MIGHQYIALYISGSGIDWNERQPEGREKDVREERELFSDSDGSELRGRVDSVVVE